MNVIGIYNGKPAIFKRIENECISKRGRLIGNKITYEFVSTDVNFNDDIPIDSSVINNNSGINIQDYDLTLPKIDPSVFKFGKYKNEKIVECTDIDYLVWYYPNIVDNLIKDKVIQMISEKYFYKDNKFYKKDISYSQNALELISDLNSGKSAIIKFDKNISATGSYITPDEIIINFQNYKSMKFGGMSYGLAGNSNGHYSRLKNKNIKICKYEFNHNPEINRYILLIEEFELLK